MVNSSIGLSVHCDRENQAVTPFGRLVLESEGVDLRLGDMLGPASYVDMLSDQTYRVTVGGNFPEPIFRSYREKKFEEGIYVGHHIGPPAKLLERYANTAIYIKQGDSFAYQKILWHYVMKMCLSTQSFVNAAAHVKGATLFDKEGQGILLLGRGGSGKSTLARFLVDSGLLYGGNTHAIIKGGQVWAVNTWQRIREHGTQYFEPPVVCTHPLSGKLRKIFVVEHNLDGDFQYDHWSESLANAFIETFGLASMAYDLKEDLIDTLGRDVFLAGIAAERMELRELVKDIGVFRINSDVRYPRCRSEIQSAVFCDLCV